MGHAAFQRRNQIIALLSNFIFQVKDFVYPDDYSEPLEAYLNRTGQVDEAGQLLTTNSRASGRFHSSWLNMMYPRLLLARQLLKDDGSIFVSIDDNEIHNLREIRKDRLVRPVRLVRLIEKELHARPVRFDRFLPGDRIGAPLSRIVTAESRIHSCHTSLLAETRERYN